MNSESKIKKLILQFLLICDFALISREGKLSIIGIFDRIFIRGFPANYPKMFVVGSVTGQRNSLHAITFQVTDPDGKELIQANSPELSITLDERGNGNFTLELANFPITQIGEYRVTIQENGNKIGSTIYHVSLMKQVNTGNTIAN